MQPEELLHIKHSDSGDARVCADYLLTRIAEVACLELLVEDGLGEV